MVSLEVSRLHFMSTLSMLATDNHPANQSCQRHEGYLNGGKAVGGLLTLLM